MKVVVFGSGAVGAYFGGRLAQSGVDVSFIARGEHLQKIREQGLRVDSIKGDFIIQPCNATDDCQQIGQADLVLVCVKGWQVAESLAQIEALVGEHTSILPLLNGVDAVTVLSQHFGKEKVLNGLCGIFAKQVGPGHIAHMGADPWMQFGEQDSAATERANQVLSVLESSDGFRSTLVDDINVAVWRKFIFIASTSGVGSVTRANFGEVRENVQTTNLLKSLIVEIINVARAHLVALPDDIEALIWQQFAKSSGKSDTSMQRDVLAGKPSELDSQLGAVIRLAAQAGVTVPHSEMIYAALLPQENRARANIRK